MKTLIGKSLLLIFFCHVIRDVDGFTSIYPRSSFKSNQQQQQQESNNIQQKDNDDIKIVKSKVSKSEAATSNDQNIDDFFSEELEELLRNSTRISKHLWNIYLHPPTNMTGHSQSQQARSFKSGMSDQCGANSISRSSINSRLIDAASSINLKTTEKIMEKLKKSSAKDPMKILATIKQSNPFCPFKVIQNQCNPSNPFSLHDGSCNNLINPWLGKSETPYKRYLLPEYDDGFNTPRSRSRSGRPLPNPRAISRALFNDIDQKEVFFSHIIALFGQFIGHDITSASIATGNFNDNKVKS
jgi:hypothetical protein